MGMMATAERAQETLHRVLERRRSPRGEPHRRATPGAGAGAGTGAERLAQALGLFGIGLGLAEVFAPRDVARSIGVVGDHRTETIVRALGLREITSGVGILARERPAGWLWSRVAGDAMDLAFLGSAWTRSLDRNRVAAALVAVAGVTALDILTGQRLSRGPQAPRPQGPLENGIRVRETITVNRPADEVYRFWHDFENLPSFMEHLESVQVSGSRSRWTARAPAGMRISWDADLAADRPGELIAWRSVEGSSVAHVGAVRFTPTHDGKATVVSVDLRYSPPAGRLGAGIAKLFGEEPGQQVRDDLRRLKQLMETGEIPVSEGTLPGASAAQPPARPYAQRR